MNPENDRQYVRVKKITLLIVALILLAGLLGWWLGRSDGPDTSNQAGNAQVERTAEPTPNANASEADVKSRVSYSLPDGWKEFSCPSAVGSVFVVPSGEGGVDCNASPSSPVKISVDPGSNTDCNQLQSVQNVSKHICISEFINGRKSLKAETVYNKDSSYKKDTAIHAYYIDTGKGVVKVEYIHDPNNNEFQAGFDQLAKSVKVN